MPRPVALDYRRHGPDGAPPLVIAHGLLGSQSNWNSVARQLADTFAVHVLDLRNHGNSPWDDDHRYEALALDIASHIETHCPDGALLLGHSMGGKAAMATALTWPDRVRALVVVDIAPLSYPGHDHLPTFNAMLGIDTAALTSRSEAEPLLQQALPDGEGGGDSPADKAMRGFLLQNLVPAENGYRWRVNLPVLAAAHSALTGWPASLEMQRYGGPCLSIAGELSDYVAAEGRELLSSTFPDAGFARIPGAGHWPHAEAPGAFMQALRPFLEKHAG